MNIGEGQYDYEGGISVGYQNAGILNYLNLDTGYRYRAENKVIFSKPGNEIFFRFDNGILTWKNMMLNTGIEGFIGRKFDEFKFKFPDSDRRLISFNASIIKSITSRTGLILSLNVPIVGKNYNAGSIVGFGFFFYRGKHKDVQRNLNLPSVTCGSVCSI